MSDPVFVFCHIEKSAGTSFRTLLWKNYGRQNCFWYGIDQAFGEKLKPGELGGYRVVGGHFNLSAFDHAPYPMLQVAVVRDPVDRVASLFRYHARSGNEASRKQWRDWGLRPESLLQTIEDCPQFREAIDNTQCRRVCGKPESRVALERAASFPFVLATHENIDLLVEELGSALNWPFTEMTRENVAEAGYRDEILGEPGAREAAESLCVEDRKLYNAAQAMPIAGRMDRFETLHAALRPAGSKRKSYFSPSDLGLVRVEPSDPVLRATPGGTLECVVTIRNGSRRLLRRGGVFRVMLGARWGDASGEVIEAEGGRVALPENILPGESAAAPVRVRVPNSASPGEYRLELSLVQRSVCWLNQINADHVGRIDVSIA